MATTTPTYALLFDTPVDDLPAPWTDPLEFDHLQAAYGIELWPLPEVSHHQFLNDLDHDGWLERFDALVATLHVTNLDRPWGVDRVTAKAQSREYDYIAVCDVCGARLRRKATQPGADDAAAAHARTAHRWTPRSTR